MTVMVIVVVLSVVLIYLLLTINKGVSPEIIPGDVDDAVDAGKMHLPRKYLLTPDWNLIFRKKFSLIARVKSNTMKVRGLYRNDIIVAHYVSDDSGTPERGDLIVLESVEKRNKRDTKLILREYDCELGNGFIQTICYKDFNTVRSKKFKKTDIVAVVDRQLKSDTFLTNPVIVN